MNKLAISSPNYTQRNNTTNPERACNVSAATTAVVGAGWTPPSGKSSQDDENLMLFIRGSKECGVLCDSLNRKWGTSGEKYVPSEQCHEVLDLALNLWLGARVSHTVQKATVKMIMDHIDLGGTCFSSGKFPTTNGHFVAIIDYTITAGEKQPVSWTIKDPWGDYLSRYASHYGNNIIMSYDDYLKIMRPRGQVEKMMHFVMRKG